MSAVGSAASCARASITAATSATRAACTTATCRSSGSGAHKGKIVDEPEYEGWSGAGWAIGVTADKDGVAWLNTELDRACLDVNEFGWLCGWVMECHGEGLHHQEAARLRAELGRRQGRRSSDPDDRQARGLRRPPRRGRQARLGEARRRGGRGLRDLHREGRRAARPRSPGALGGDARHVHVLHGHDGDGQPRPPDGAGAARAHQPVRRRGGGQATWPAAAGAATSRTRSGSASSRSRTRLENVCRALSAATGLELHRRGGDALQGRRTAAINRAVALRCGLTPASSIRPSATARRRRTAPPRARPSARSGRRWSTPGTRKSATTARPASRCRRR